MKVLIGCEFSGTVRDAFLERGHDAWSCDILPCEADPQFHLHCDVEKAIQSGPWDLIVLHVPCTGMGVCGNGTYGRGKPKHPIRQKAVEWSLKVWDLAVKHSARVALENPASVIFPLLRKRGADVQYVQPWEHGHPEMKKTGLALHNLPRITPTNDVYEEMMKLPRKERERIFFMSPSDDRGHLRSIFFPGIAKAMADQWGYPVLSRQPELIL
jgi:hypothetical protein